MKNIFKRHKIKKINDGRSQQNIDRKSYIIHHYCPFTYNAGDHFVIRSIRNHLRAHIPNAVFIPKPCAHNRGWGKPFRLTGKNINYSNRFADAVVIGGSDQYNNWSLRLQPDELKALLPPLYLIGLGASSKKLGAPPFIEKQKFFEEIRFANAHARFSSVRDDYTNRFLQKCGFEKAVVTGCPAMFLFNEKFHLLKNGYAALTFPFPVLRGNNPQLFENLIDLLRRTMEFLNRQGVRSIISCHDDRDVNLAQEVFPEAQIFFSNYVDDFIEFYQNAAFIVGTRLHASIFCTGIGKPFINLNLDGRGQGFTETFGMGDWNIDVDQADLFENLQSKIEQILNGDLTVFEKLYAVKEGYRDQFLAFMKNVADDIVSKRGGK